MGLSIDQILNECRDEIQTFELEKNASTAKVVSSTDDVTAMVELLKVASIPEIIEPEQSIPSSTSIYEKVAEAAIVSSLVQEVNTQGTKLAEFREKALAKGHNPSEVDAFIEKQASVASLFKSPVAKKALLGLGAAAAIAGGTAAGHKAGTDKQKEVTRTTGRAAFSAGRKYQYARGRALSDRRKRIVEYLRRLKAQKSSQGK